MSGKRVELLKDIKPDLSRLAVLANTGNLTAEPNVKDLEREVVRILADLFRAPPDDRWGCVTSGGTEGNLYGRSQPLTDSLDRLRGAEGVFVIRRRDYPAAYVGAEDAWLAAACADAGFACNIGSERHAAITAATRASSGAVAAWSR